MPHIHNKHILNNRRKELRKNATQEEIQLWELLRNKRLGFKFYRQHSIGYYITDFYCAEKKLVIEIDGFQHLENKEYDKERNRYFESLGYKIIRFWNNEISTNLNGVVEKIHKHLSRSSPHPPKADFPSP